ncbi:MAG: LCP family protein [Clostridiales bacterium]|nr:LCP family protein [Clostridiales bacterium]
MGTDSVDEVDKSTMSTAGSWKIAVLIILIIQLALSAGTMAIAVWTGFFPVMYLLIAGIVLIALLCASCVLMCVGMRKKNDDAKEDAGDEGKKHTPYVRRGVGCAISCLVMALCIIVSAMLVRAGTTISTVTSQTNKTETTSVYVLVDDPAETVEDAADYTFAITESYDYEHTREALEEINELTGAIVKTREYDTVFDMVDALYDGEVEAMILNLAYVDLLEAEDGYEDFSDRTRVLYYHEIETAVEATPSYDLEEEQEDRKRDITVDPFIIYISGSDTRTSKLTDDTRSDANIILVVNPSTRQVLMVNTPRDYYVDISISPGNKDKLTHCGIYGVDCSMDTLSNLYGEQVDYYAKINFNGFKTLIDAIGGITVYSEKTFTTSEGGYRIYQGENTLNGDMALSYVRERKAFSDGDDARGRHQMQVISAIIDKVSSGTTVLANYSAILSSLEGMFVTNMTSDEIASLVRMELSDTTPWNVLSYAVTGTGSKQYVYSIKGLKTYVTIPDEDTVERARTLIDRTMAGEVLSEEDVTS